MITRGKRLFPLLFFRYRAFATSRVTVHGCVSPVYAQEGGFFSVPMRHGQRFLAIVFSRFLRKMVSFFSFRNGCVNATLRRSVIIQLRSTRVSHLLSS